MKKTSTADQQRPSPGHQQVADWVEVRLRALHELIPDAMDFPDLAGPYISFVRSMRERVHPVGTPEVRIVETRSGLKFNVDLGDRLGCDFYYGYFGEAFESEIFMRLVRPGAVILDVGANFGFYALNAAIRAGEGGVVHAFEPVPAAYRLLCDNVAANRLNNAHSHQVCIGAEDGETDFYVMEESAFSGITSTGRSRLREKITVPLRRLDSIASELGLVSVDALKIDVEGYEFAVLRGARQIIDRSPGLLIQLEVCSKNLTDKKYDALETVLADLYSQGFMGWHIDSGTDGIVECSGVKEAIRQSAGNVFFVQSGSDIERRLRDMCKALRAEAFHDFATRSGLAAEPLLTRNPADSHNGLRLHAALLDSVLRDRQGRIDRLERQNQDRLDRLRVQASEVSEWKARFTRTEEDSKQRLDLLCRLQEEVAQWKERHDLVEHENVARLELIRKLEGQFAEYKARCTVADQWKARLETVEAESRTRLDLLRKQEAAAAEWRERYVRAEEESRARLEVARRWEAEAEKWKARAATAEGKGQNQEALEMDQVPGSGRAFFVSIPKCGKNVIHTFFDALDLTRFEVKLDGAVQYTHAKYVEALHRSGAPVPVKPSLKEILEALERLRPQFVQFLDAVRRMSQGTWVNQHFAFNEELHQVLREAGIPIVFLCRDPRDCVLSMANFLVNRGEPADWLPKLPRRDLDTALAFFLAGDDERLPFAQVFDSYRGWLQAEGVLVLRFEDIIGPKGGGCEGTQIEHFTALAEHIGWQGSPHRLAHAILSSFNPRAGTFYKGQIGAWRESFAPWMLQLFEQRAGHLLDAWDYTDPTAPRTADAHPVEDATMSLVAAMRQEYHEMIAEFEGKLQDKGKESEERLALVLEHQMATAEWRERYVRAEEESRARLEVVRRWEAEAEKWKARCAAAEKENEQLAGEAPERSV